MNPLTRLRAAFALDSFCWFLGDLPEFPEPEDPGCWRLLSHGEAESWVRDHGTERADQRRSQEVALEHKHLLFVASLEGRDVGHVWAARGWMYAERPDCVRVHLAPGDHLLLRHVRRQAVSSAGCRLRGIPLPSADGAAERPSTLRCRGDQRKPGRPPERGVPGPSVVGGASLACRTPRLLDQGKALGAHRRSGRDGTGLSGPTAIRSRPACERGRSVGLLGGSSGRPRRGRARAGDRARC